MVTKDNIIDMYIHLRKTNMSIPDEALEFMKNVCLSKLENKTEVHICTDFNISLNDMKMRNKKVEQPPNGNIYQIEISNR